MKKKTSSKKCIALVLAMVMIITSIPFMMVGAEITPESYDPAPYFSEDAIKQGADAWLDDDGNIRVEFPSATPVKTFKGEETTIAFYILELVDMGAKNAVHQKNILDTIKATGTSATFKADNIGEIDFENKRYGVAITAVDSENWFSQSMYATVSEIPAITLEPEKFEGFSASPTAVREIMTFDGATGTDSGTVIGNQLLYMGLAQEAGTEDLTDNIGDTSALRFIMNEKPTSTQIFDTSYSRSTWDYKGATEMWYWMDLSEVELKGVSFRLRSNEKMWLEWIDDDKTLDTEQRVGSVVYSTKGTAASAYTGEDPYIYVQREDGGWDKVMLNDDGTADIGNFKGYVRVPLKFMCSETDSYIDISNQDLATGHDYKSGINNSVQDADVQNWLRSMTFGKITVDKAGTSIQDALLIHRRGLRSSSGFLNAGDRHLYLFNADGIEHWQQSYTSGNPAIDYSKAGYMLAVPLDEAKAKTSVTTGNYSADRAYIANGTVQNREAGLKAIEDIYNAGFSVEGCSEDSLQHSFFVDNIFFYRTDGGTYTEQTLNGKANTGDLMSVYYDETLEISRIIFDEIDKYIEDPDWADYREITYILDLIEKYRQIYSSKGKDTTFLSLEKVDDGDGVGLAAAAEKLGRDSWAKAWDAYEKCVAAGTYGSANADKDELVPVIIRAMEKLPAPENITTVSEALRTEIVKIWKAYAHLNIGQLDMLGKDEEVKILQYVGLLDGTEKTADDFVVGQQLADFPYIVYNDFENLSIGSKGWQLENNKDAFSVDFKSTNGLPVGTHDPANGIFTMANSWRHTKGLVTYTTNGNTNITDKDYYGYSPDDAQYVEEVMDNKLHYNASSAEITDNGYMNTHAATVNIDSAFETNENDGVFHTVTFSRHGQDANSWNNFKANNTGLDGLGRFSTQNSNGSETVALSLIFYVDFSELSNFYFTTNIYAMDGTVPHKFRVDMGNALLGNFQNQEAYKKDNWKYFILHPETGEWVINRSTSEWCFTSERNEEWGDELGLAGYKGYLMIPLYHIKSGAIVLDGSDKLDSNSGWLNSIFAIQFCIGGDNPDSLDEKSYTIDNVGFTYDPAGYASHTYKSYAETFGAKSLPAKQFEDAVDAIDIYDESTRATKVSEALALYNALPAYQKTVVADAKATLDKYQRIVNGTETLETALYTVDQLNTLVASLPDAIKNTSVSGEFDIPHPGYVAGEVNYASMGIDKTTAEQIIDYYNNGYKKFSVAQKEMVTNATEFLNAYNMAMRMTATLENIKNDALTFLPEITSLFTRKYDYNDDGILDNYDANQLENTELIGNFLSIKNRASAEDFFEEKYSPLQYYSKTSIDDGSIYPQLENTSRGFTYFLKNTETYTIDGETIKGGILTFQEKLENIKTNAQNKLDEEELFTSDEIQKMKDALDEYNSFLRAYYNVEELYELAQEIIRLFPKVITEDVDVSEIMLSEDKLIGDKSTYKVTYSEIFDYDESGEYYAVRVYSKNGAMNNDYGDSVVYNLAINSDSEESGTILEATPYEATVANNTYSPSSPWNFEITPSIDAKPTGLRGAISDTLTVQLILFDTITTEENGVSTTESVETLVDEQTIIVSYSPSDYYTVTIPATIQVDWNDSAEQDVSYSVTSELSATSKITVGVTDKTTGFDVDSNTGKLVADANNYLTYTATNFVETEFVGSASNQEPTNKPHIQIAGWEQVPVGTYRTTLTYTVTYSDGTP